MYEIISTYNGKSEVIDTASSLQEAKYLVGKYQMAYGSEWYIHKRKVK